MSEKYYALEQVDRKANLYIFGTITAYPWREKDRDAYGIVKEIADLDADEIHVHINSTGGSVAEGLSIYNVLKDSEMKVVTYCTGFACSAASVIFMAGDERIMHEASALMVHDAWTGHQGNADSFRKQADDLDKITQLSVKTYMRHAKISEEEIRKLMKEETWISPDEAKEYGLATKIYEEKIEGVNQSAMYNILDRILGKATESNIVHQGIKVPTAQEIAQAIVKEFETKQQPKENSAWSAFFNVKKED